MGAHLGKKHRNTSQSIYEGFVGVLVDWVSSLDETHLPSYGDNSISVICKAKEVTLSKVLEKESLLD